MYISSRMIGLDNPEKTSVSNVKHAVETGMFGL